MMKKIIFAAVALLLTVWAANAQVTPTVRPIKPITNAQVTKAPLPTLQDTLNMLLVKVQALEAERLAGGKKTVKVITPTAANMCFPFKNSKFPSQAFYQGVVVDDAVCNNNPNAVLIVTVKTGQPQQSFPVSVSYDAADGRWKISIQGYMVSDLAKNVRCYNFEGKDPSMCPPSGLYHDVGIMNPVTLSPGYDNKIEFNVLITEKQEVKLPKIVRKE